VNVFRALLVVAILSGCATLDRPFSDHLQSPVLPERECADWFAALDAAVESAGVRDVQEARIPGFPYLRVNRYLNALKSRARTDAGIQAYALRLSALDYEARKAEIGNLPEERLAALPLLLTPGSRREAVTRTRQCAHQLREIDVARPEVREMLLSRTDVPDDYSTALRVAGLYALTRIPFAAGVRRWESEMTADFARARESESRLPVVRYAPPPVAPRSRDAIGRLIIASAANPLGVPEPARQDLADLLAAYAPSFDVEVAGDYDRFGPLRWLRERRTPTVEASEQVVYAHTSRTLYHGHTLLQFVYTIWFPERPPREPNDLLAGTLDGVVWRVTLAPDGEPLIYDTIHPCGCFHMFFPTPRAHALPAPDEYEEWAFSPQQLPRVRAGERPLLKIATGTHYIERVSFVEGMDSVSHYELRDYDGLRSLPSLEGGSRSAFGVDGLVPGTERPERRLFWPMGIRSAGAMRQWGRHATAFVGRRHFDDPDLFEKRFELDLQ
jgi:hypothetical protein